MNYSTAVFLINDDVRAVAAIYEPDDEARNGAAKRTVFKTLDQTIDVDDIVIVESGTRHGYTIVKVVEVDVDLDLESSAKVEWVVGTVDLEDHQRLLAQEKKATDQIRRSELLAKRRRMRANLLAEQEESLKALELSTINGDHDAPAVSGPEDVPEGD